MVVGDNGIIAKVQTAKKNTEKTQTDELDQLADYEEQIDTLGRAVSKSLDYSMKEQVVGKWIDGKPIYQITLQYNGTSVLEAKNLDFDHATKVSGITDVYMEEIKPTIKDVISCYLENNTHKDGHSRINQPFYFRKDNGCISGIDDPYSKWWGFNIFPNATLTILYTKTTD